MRSLRTLADVLNEPAVYALVGGKGNHTYVAYVGIAGKLRNRLAQHCVFRDSGVTTGTSATTLNSDCPREIRWWGDESTAHGGRER